MGISYLGKLTVPSIELGTFIEDLKKWEFLQAVTMSIIVYGCTPWVWTKCLEKKPDGNYARMLHAILNTSWKQHPTKQQLHGHLLPISQTMLGTAGDIRTNMKTTFSYGLLNSMTATLYICWCLIIERT